MSYQRLLLHYGPNTTDYLGLLNENAVRGCWFQLDRLGGCGQAEIKLNLKFIDRQQIQLGDWIAFDPEIGTRWYFGRVVERISTSPHGITLKLTGMSEMLNELFPGGFDEEAGDQAAPLRAGVSRAFSNDPDFSRESYFYAADAWQLIKELMDRYIVSETPIQKVSALLEEPYHINGTLESIKVRGEESIRSLIKELATRLGNASWGVDANAQFYFLNPRTSSTHSYHQGRDLIELRESLNLDDVYNRVVLTGDYIYDREKSSGQQARPAFRWRGHYTAPESIQQHGQRRLRIWLPWIRTAADSQAFMQGFFQRYAYAAAKYQFTIAGSLDLPSPWNSAIELIDSAGNHITTQQPQSIKVQYDAIPRFSFSLGTEDPRQLWSEPQHDERWELPEDPPSGFGGNSVDYSIDLPSGGGSSSTPPPGNSSSYFPPSSDTSSDDSFDESSLYSSEYWSSHSSYESSWSSSTPWNSSSHPSSSQVTSNSSSQHSSQSSQSLSSSNPTSSHSSNLSLSESSQLSFESSSNEYSSEQWTSSDFPGTSSNPGSSEVPNSSSSTPNTSSFTSTEISTSETTSSDLSYNTSSYQTWPSSLDTYGYFSDNWDSITFT